tara:strand:+ start:500 stop:619 length:120 start_codon:yes stop_codon:yes gene_type:complete
LRWFVNLGGYDMSTDHVDCRFDLRDFDCLSSYPTTLTIK